MNIHRLASSGMALLGLIVSAALPAAAAEKPVAAGSDAGAAVSARKLGDGGAWELVEDGKPILRYHYGMVAEPEEIKKLVSPANRRYAVDRCDYIHPLYGPRGEVLTEDWPKDHPHHRGIYWAWPEVDWQGKRGDLHALQEVFARPTGKIRAVEGPESAQIEAESQWCWNGVTPVIREEATLRAWRRTDAGRRLDLEFHFTAIGADVQVARRDRTHYGGLNLRFAPLAEQNIVTFTDPPAAAPRMAWAQRSGVLAGGRSVALAILQDPRNPDYPGDWVQYPSLSWIQPTFPAAGTRYTIAKDRPLVLRFHLWICDRSPAPEAMRDLWRQCAAK
jgi:hypothetical protein